MEGVQSWFATPARWRVLEENARHYQKPLFRMHNVGKTRWVPSSRDFADRFAINLPVFRLALTNLSNDDEQIWVDLEASEKNRLASYVDFMNTYRFMAGLAIWRDLVEIEARVTKQLEGSVNLCVLASILTSLPQAFMQLKDSKSAGFWHAFNASITASKRYQVNAAGELLLRANGLRARLKDGPEITGRFN